MNTSRGYIFLGVVLLSVFLGARLVSLENERREIREDLIELSLVKYGLFNIDEWKRVVTEVVTKKVEEFDLTEGNRKEMRRRINGFLTQVVNDLEGRFRKENRGLLGSVKNVFSDFLGVFDKIKRDVPQFTEEILNFLDDKGNREDIRNYVLEKVNDYADNTFAETDYTYHDLIIAKYGFDNRADTVAALNEATTEIDARRKPYAYTLMVIFLGLIIWLIANRPRSRLEMSAIIICSFIPLFLGVFLPMIEIDARIAEMRFQLLGEPVSFTDQVIYYKSKSILEVVELMMVQGKPDLIAVGLLVLAFSVLFPLSKLIACMLYLYRASVRESKVLRFFVFKSGKWSMADVMVIAIFMSYIGFSGIISEQLNQLEGLTQTMDILTTNRSSLQTGFFMFTGFVLLSLMISQRIPDVISADEQTTSNAEN